MLTADHKRVSAKLHVLSVHHAVGMGNLRVGTAYHGMVTRPINVWVATNPSRDAFFCEDLQCLAVCDTLTAHPITPDCAAERLHPGYAGYAGWIPAIHAGMTAYFNNIVT